MPSAVVYFSRKLGTFISGRTARNPYKKTTKGVRIAKIQNHICRFPGSFGWLPPSNFIELEITAAISRNTRAITTAITYAERD